MLSRPGRLFDRVSKAGAESVHLGVGLGVGAVAMTAQAAKAGADGVQAGVELGVGAVAMTARSGAGIVRLGANSILQLGGSEAELEAAQLKDQLA